MVCVMRDGSYLLFLALASSGCFQATFDGMRGGDASASGDAGRSDGSTEGDESPETNGTTGGQDAATDSGLPDAEAESESDSGPQADAGSDAEVALSPWHPSCNTRAPSPLPSEPVLRDDDGDSYAGWKKLECDDPDVWMVVMCDDAYRCSDTEVCVRPEPSQPGLCASSSIEAPGTLPWLFVNQGTCAVSVPSEVRRAACCPQEQPPELLWLADVDCGDGPRGPGGECLTHQNCEPGLVCRAEKDWYYGICTCPDVSPEMLTFNSCIESHPPTAWGAIATARDEGSCIDGLSSGWVEEVVAKGRFESLAAASSGSSVYVLSAGPAGELEPQTLLHARAANGTWTHSVFAEKHASGLAMAFAADNSMHVAACSENKLFAGIGALDPTLIDAGCVKLDLSIDSAGQSVIVYNAIGNVSAKLARQTMSGWSTALVGTERNYFAPTVTIDGDGYVHIWHGTGFHATVRSGVAIHSNEEAILRAEQSDLTQNTGATPLVAFTDPLDLFPTIYVVGLDDTTATPEQAWVRGQSDHGIEPLQPRIVFAPDGEPAIAHRAPSGLRYTKRAAGEWSSIPVVPEVNLPAENLQLLFDAADNPHILYAVDLHGEERFTQELRHAYRGTCPE